jgi:hypothetical protein
MKNTIPIHCKNANGTDKYLVYCCIFCCPDSHCSVSCSSLGITDHSNCIIIDAFMKGARPMAINEKFSNDHHNIIIKYHNHPVSTVHICHISSCIFTNGTGI